MSRSKALEDFAKTLPDDPAELLRVFVKTYANTDGLTIDETTARLFAVWLKATAVLGYKAG